MGLTGILVFTLLFWFVILPLLIVALGAWAVIVAPVVLMAGLFAIAANTNMG